MVTQDAFFAIILGRLQNDSSHASLLLTTNVKEEGTRSTLLEAR